MRSWTIAFAAGIFAGGFAPAAPPAGLALMLLAAGALLHACRPARRPGAALLGLGWILLYAHDGVAARWPQALEGVDVWIEGRVWSVPEPTERALRVEFMIEAYCAGPLRQCDFASLPPRRQKVLLSVYEPLDLRPGQRWRLQVRLRAPRGFANPGGFDYEAWLMQNRIRATGYVRDGPRNLLLEENAGGRGFERVRAALAARLADVAPELRHPHLILALGIGLDGGIPAAEWDLFSATGTSHLIVISGFHVALAALVLYRLGWWLATRSGWLMLRWPAPQVAAAFALGGAWLYAGLAGFSLPVQRALVMAAVVLAGKLLRRQTSLVDALCLALVLTLIGDPLAPQNAGFWLSYGAVAALLALSGPGGVAEEASAPGWFLRGLLELRTQFVLFVALLPVMLAFFQQVSPAAPLVNLAAIPWVGFLVVPLCLLALPLVWYWPAASVPLLRLCDLLLQGFIEALRWCVEANPLDFLTLPALGPLPFVLLCLSATLATLAPQRRLRLVALACLPPIFLWPQERLAEGRVRVTVLDVGQGLAVALTTREHALLYDTGPYFSRRFDAGSDVVVPYLRHANVRRLDRVIVSHGDSDHAGGLAGVAAAWPGAGYLAPALALLPPGLDAMPCRAGARWTWDGVSFELLHPDGEGYGSNDGSCVLRVEAGGHSLLLPGDIERRAERSLLRRGLVHPATIVVAPHHGSRTSSAPDFLAALRPAVVVWSSGYRNRFNHPAADVQARYSALGARAFGTAASGALVFELGGSAAPQVREWRRERRRFWSWEPGPEQGDGR